MKFISIIIAFLAILPFMGKTQTIVFHENFEAPLYGDSVVSSQTSSSINQWAISSVFHNSGTSADTCQVVQGDTTYLTTVDFSTLGNTSVFLHFDHICKVEWADGAEIQVSSDNGVTWTSLPSSAYLGNGQFTGEFTSVSYVNTWNPTNDGAIPTNSWWQHETFDISSYASNASQVKIRFLFKRWRWRWPNRHNGNKLWMDN